MLDDFRVPCFGPVEIRGERGIGPDIGVDAALGHGASREETQNLGGKHKAYVFFPVFRDDAMRCARVEEHGAALGKVAVPERRVDAHPTFGDHDELQVIVPLHESSAQARRVAHLAFHAEREDGERVAFDRVGGLKRRVELRPVNARRNGLPFFVNLNLAILYKNRPINSY